VTTLVAWHAKIEAMLAPVVGSGGVYTWRESWVRRSIFVGRHVWQKSGFSRRDVFYFLCFIKTFRKFCTLNAIFKYNAAIKCFSKWDLRFSRWQVWRSIRYRLIALMMEAVRASETSVYFNETTRHYIPQGNNLQLYYRSTQKRFIPVKFYGSLFTIIYAILCIYIA
jgi:hypothetical protein